MKKQLLYLGVAVSLTFNSCQTIKNTNKTQRGAAIGVAGGAALGALIGGKDNRALGAIIGAAVGGAAGGVIGNKMDKQAKEIENILPGAEVIRTEEGIQVILDEKSDVRFATSQYTLTSKSKNNLLGLIDVFKTYSDTNITIFGFTDSVGSDESNLILSQRRAKSVINFLSNNGINNSRLKSIGIGEKQPRFTNDTEEGRAGNRRVEFAITANEKMIEEAKKQTNQ